MWVALLTVDYSGYRDNKEVLQIMEHNEEPEFSLLLTPVDAPDGEEGKGDPEGGDEVHHPLPHRPE